MAASTVDQIINAILEAEGGFVDNPADRGGPTKFGITQATARLNGYTGAMKDLPVEIARKIYTDAYFERPGFGLVAKLSKAIAAELTDTGVNMGVVIASQFLQRTINALNRQAKLYPDVEVDGHIGPKTVGCLSTFLRARGNDGERVILSALNALQGERYIKIAEQDRTQEEFVFGWLLNRVLL